MKTKCPNTCKEDGVEIRKTLYDNIKSLEKGIITKQGYIVEGKTLFSQKQEKYEILEQEFNKIQEEINDLESKKNNLEKIEEAERNLLKEEEKKKEEQSSHPEIGISTPESETQVKENVEQVEETPKQVNDFSNYKNEGKLNTQTSENIGMIERVQKILTHTYYSTIHYFYSFNFNKTGKIHSILTFKKRKKQGKFIIQENQSLIKSNKNMKV